MAVGDLELDQDLDSQKRGWLMERIGWMLMTLAALAALAGLLGPGPLSSATAGTPDGPIWVEYNRFERHQNPTRLHLHFRPNGGEPFARVWVDRAYLHAMQIQQVTPPPDSVETGSERLIYIFRYSQPDQPISIMFDLNPDQVGLHTGRMGVENGAELTFSQFVYP